MDHNTQHPSPIVFFDVETIYPTSVIVEFGAILVCPNTLKELLNYSTLVRPDDPSLVPPVFERRNGITRDALAAATTFADIADTVYELLHERIWAGHNIFRFDCNRIRKAFSDMNRPPPEPKAIIDSLPLLTDTFGRRAGDMKMASLAAYFGLGQQTHRSLDDVRMNLEVIKYCATIMFLESRFPKVFTVNSCVSPPNTPIRNHSKGKPLLDGDSSDVKMKSISQVASHPTSTTEMCSSVVVANNLAQQQFSGFPPQMSSSAAVLPEAGSNTFAVLKTESMLSSPIANQCNEEKHPTSPISGSESKTYVSNPVQRQLFGHPQPQMSSQAALSEASSSTVAVLKPHEIIISSLTASLVPSYHGCLRIQLLHNGFPFQLSCADLKIRFGINGKFYNNAGRPKLSFVVDTSQSLCGVLEVCDAIAQSSFLDSAGTSSDWKPLVVTRKDGFFNYPTVRLQIPISECGDAAIFETEVDKKETSTGIVQRLRLNKADTKELSSLLMPGNLVDSIFSLDQYEYQQSVGIRLVAKKLIFHK